VDMPKPKIIQDVGFDFDWDSRKVWALEEPITKMDISELVWHFEIPFWEIKGTDDYNLSPREVMAKPNNQVHALHWNKIQTADTSHPIDIMENKGRWLILDGLHRLVKLYLVGAEKVEVRIIPRSRIPEILKD
jgi:hypothetical protein